jgi:hypothetical protein
MIDSQYKIILEIILWILSLIKYLSQYKLNKKKQIFALKL